VSDAVVDASAILAVLRAEPGAEQVIALGSGPRASAVNVSEVAAKLAERGAAEEHVRSMIDGLELKIEPFGYDDAVAAGLLRPETRAAGLSLGDRACLALATGLGLPVVTADRRWAKLGLPLEVRAIR
jgi:ribonuclease VapC